MRNTKILSVIPVIALVIGMTALSLTGCANPAGGGGNTEPKTLDIIGVPKNIISQVTTSDEMVIYIVPAGKSGTFGNISVAEVVISDFDGSSITTQTYDQVDIPLFVKTGIAWTGRGTYDVYFLLMTNGQSVAAAKYIAASVNITEAKTIIAWSKFASY